MIVAFMQVRCTAAISSFHTASVAVPASSPAAAPLLALMLHALLSPRLTEGLRVRYVRSGSGSWGRAKTVRKTKVALKRSFRIARFPCTAFWCDLCRAEFRSVVSRVGLKAVCIAIFEYFGRSERR